MKGLLIAALAALGTILAGMVKADLEDEEVCRWLARKLVYRATERLPADERDRWREELVRDLLDLKGRLPPLWWALSTWLQAGRWGRERGVPSRWETLAIRARLMWERLRSLTAKRSRSRSMQRHPSVQVQAEPAQLLVAAADATAVIRPASITSGQAFGTPKLFVGYVTGPAGQPHLSDQEFVAWLSRERQTFEDDLDQRIAAWRQAKAWRRVEAWRQDQA